MKDSKGKVKSLQPDETDVKKLFAQVEGYFSPKVIGSVNDLYIKITRVKGDDVPWHAHDNEDELFYIVKGSLMMVLENEEPFPLNEGGLFIVPQGVQHRVYSDQECWVLLIEHAETKHTGDVQSSITKSVDQQLGQG